MGTRTHLGALLGFVVVLLTLLASCGADQVAGIEGSGAPVASDVTTTGRINGFGSIFIDGVEYDGRKPNAYIEKLTVGLKGQQKIEGGDVVGR